MTIWNEAAAPDPKVLFDYNNVLNAYPMELLAKQARVTGLPYAIVSLLMTQGDNFNNLRERAKNTGECIIALTAKIKGNRVKVETSLKYVAMKKMHWENVQCAIDDKPHEWYHSDSNISQSRKLDSSYSSKDRTFENKREKPIKLSLDSTKKNVFKVKIEN